jgi:hypothetical protein
MSWSLFVAIFNVFRQKIAFLVNHRYGQFFVIKMMHFEQDCQIVYFYTQNPTLGKFGRALE